MNSEKVYPTFRKLTEFKKPYHVRLGSKLSKNKKKKIMDQQKEDLLTIQSLARTKTTIKDIILCNTFEHFCTFTFKDHRDDVEICKSRMQYWLKSQQKIYGAFNYLIVPEFHKDGESLHFHALFNGYKGKMEKAYKKTTGEPVLSHTGKQVYRLSGWRSGFSDATIIDQSDDSRAKVANYVTKYITKDMPVFHGKKRFWVSQELLRPIKSVNVDPQPYHETPLLVKESENDLYTTYIVDNDSFPSK